MLREGELREGEAKLLAGTDVPGKWQGQGIHMQTHADGCVRPCGRLHSIYRGGRNIQAGKAVTREKCTECSQEATEIWWSHGPNEKRERSVRVGGSDGA